MHRQPIYSCFYTSIFLYGPESEPEARPPIAQMHNNGIHQNQILTNQPTQFVLTILHDKLQREE